jgi:hypothetical protein
MRATKLPRLQYLFSFLRGEIFVSNRPWDVHVAGQRKTLPFPLKGEKKPRRQVAHSPLAGPVIRVHHITSFVGV